MIGGGKWDIVHLHQQSFSVTHILLSFGAVCMAGSSLGSVHLLLHSSPEQLH